jgi:hypothetical protein
MKRQLLAGLAAGLLGVSGLVAQQQPASMGQQGQMMQGWQQYPGQTWRDRLCQTGRFTLAGEYFYRTVREKSPFSLVNFMVFNHGDVDLIDGTLVPDFTNPQIAFQTVLSPWSVKGHGNFGTVYTAYQYRNNDEPYFALRARWASGKLKRRHSDDDGVTVTNDILAYIATVPGEFQNVDFDTTAPFTFSPFFTGDNFFVSQPFHFGRQAHEWNVEARLGYTFGAGACDQFGFTPYLGVGYEGGRMTLPNAGRQLYWWWYIPVGFVASYQFNPNFSMALDGEFGMMADASLVRFDDPATNNIHRKFDNKYRWELELPLNYQFVCWGCGTFSLGLVPFWHGWKTWEKLQGESTTRHDLTQFGVEATTNVQLGLLVAGGALTTVDVDMPSHYLFQNVVEEFDAPVATPRMLNNSWGGRLEFGWMF